MQIVRDPTRFRWMVTIAGEKAMTIDFSTGQIVVGAGYDLRAGTVPAISPTDTVPLPDVVLGDRLAYRKAWCSLVDKEDPSEILVVFEIYTPAEGRGEEYDVIINDKYMPENKPAVEPPEFYEEEPTGGQ